MKKLVSILALVAFVVSAFSVFSILSVGAAPANLIPDPTFESEIKNVNWSTFQSGWTQYLGAANPGIIV